MNDPEDLKAVADDANVSEKGKKAERSAFASLSEPTLFAAPEPQAFFPRNGSARCH